MSRVSLAARVRPPAAAEFVPDWSLAWVGLDFAEAVAALLTAWLLSQGSPRAGLPAMAGAGLLFADAWFDVHVGRRNGALAGRGRGRPGRAAAGRRRDLARRQPGADPVSALPAASAYSSAARQQYQAATERYGRNTSPSGFSSFAVGSGTRQASP
jgi:hypothetical protein